MTAVSVDQWKQESEWNVFQNEQKKEMETAGLDNFWRCDCEGEGRCEILQSTFPQPPKKNKKKKEREKD